jgi:hypothetical protein
MMGNHKPLHRSSFHVEEMMSPFCLSSVSYKMRTPRNHRLRTSSVEKLPSNAYIAHHCCQESIVQTPLPMGNKGRKVCYICPAMRDELKNLSSKDG